MSPGAKRFWKRYAPMLSELGILKETDLPALRMTAELWSKWMRLTNRVNSGKLEPADELGYMRLLDRLESQMLKYLQQFGMTASSRGRISIGDRPEEEEPDYLD
jgi:P27 family predicted phage terminase small subunit